MLIVQFAHLVPLLHLQGLSMQIKVIRYLVTLYFANYIANNDDFKEKKNNKTVPPTA